MDKSWHDWLNENLKAGCNLNEVMAILKKNNFDDATIIEALKNSDTMIVRSELNYHALSTIRITRDPRARKIENDHVQLYALDGFMTPAECTKIAKLVERNMARSFVNEKDSYNITRTSKTCALGLMDDPLVEVIDTRIAETIGINLLYSDIIEGQHYSVGQEFKAHHDYFTHGFEPHVQYMQASGNRTWTFMVYLNDDCEGGGTHFPKINYTFTPKIGTAVIWNNLLPSGHPNPYSLHAGMPVLKGEKAVITKWFREYATTPMRLD